MPEAQIDAAEGRTIAKALPIIKTMGASGQIRQTLVLSVTANSTILDGQLDEVLAAMPADSKLVLVTGYGPRNLSWIEYSNTKIHEFASQHSDRVIIAVGTRRFARLCRPRAVCSLPTACIPRRPARSFTPGSWSRPSPRRRRSSGVADSHAQKPHRTSHAGRSNAWAVLTRGRPAEDVLKGPLVTLVRVANGPFDSAWALSQPARG